MTLRNTGVTVDPVCLRPPAGAVNRQNLAIFRSLGGFVVVELMSIVFVTGATTFVSSELSSSGRNSVTFSKMFGTCTFKLATVVVVGLDVVDCGFRLSGSETENETIRI